MSLIYQVGQRGYRQKSSWEEALRPFSTSQEPPQKGLGLALVQAVQPPPPLEWLIDFCGQDRLCLGVAGKVLAASIFLSPRPRPPQFGLVGSGGLRGQSTTRIAVGL